jgi:hypothetical protein
MIMATVFSEIVLGWEADTGYTWIKLYGKTKREAIDIAKASGYKAPKFWEFWKDSIYIETFL